MEVGQLTISASLELDSAWWQPFAEEAQGLSDLTYEQQLGFLSESAAQRRLFVASGQPLSFVENGGSDIPYETWIYKTGQVPTRSFEKAAWHDLFNALVWLAFPLTKAFLNQTQAATIARDGVREKRGPLRDAITLFDESGLVLAYADQTLLDGLQNRQWAYALHTQRSAWGQQVEASVFGHALLQKLVDPYKAICGHVLAVAVDISYFSLSASAKRAVLDRKLCERFMELFDAQVHETKPYFPLPVLGIPGWCEDNKVLNFYHDTQVFRI